MRYIGIDPGKSGAIVWEDRDGVVHAENMPEDVHGLNQIAFVCASCDRAYIEKVHSMPRQGVKSTFTFGRNLGHIEMMLVSLGMPYKEVSPTVWQKAVCGALPKEKPARKKEIQRQMQALYPHLKVTLRNADALAIFAYAKEHARESHD